MPVFGIHYTFTIQSNSLAGFFRIFCSFYLIDYLLTRIWTFFQNQKHPVFYILNVLCLVLYFVCRLSFLSVLYIIARAYNSLGLFSPCPLLRKFSNNLILLFDILSSLSLVLSVEFLSYLGDPLIWSIIKLFRPSFSHVHYLQLVLARSAVHALSCKECTYT